MGKKSKLASEEFTKDFGVKSHAFLFSLSLIEEVLKQAEGWSEFEVAYENWERYFRDIYGSAFRGADLFLRHTYLVTLAKLVAWARLTNNDVIPSDEELLSILNGEFFRKQGIDNFLEEDFFSWIAQERVKSTGLDLSKKLLSLLLKYNLRELSEDVLKDIYQGLIDLKTRHSLGEHYTPDWLAQRMVEKALGEDPRRSILDPACGSGTFLYMAIKLKREALGDSSETLEHILESVVGIDINPLAVTIAKTNYLLALGDLFLKRRQSVQLPVYLADSVRLPAADGKALFNFLRGNFDVILGNPPWLTWRDVEKREYREFLKRLAEEYKLLPEKGEFIPIIDLAILFFVRTADLYLKDGGIIGFVLPRNVFNSDPLHNFRCSCFPNLGFEEVWDLDNVRPLFNIASCVFFAKKGAKTSYPLRCQIFSGKLNRKNASLNEAEQSLSITSEELFLAQIGKRSFLTTSKPLVITAESFYKSRFKAGAHINPRSFWFVEIKPHPILGFDPSLPYVQTAWKTESYAKPAYKDLRLEGNIEPDFLYATLLSADIFYFGYRGFSLVILPVLKSNSGFKILKADEARNLGFLNLANWLEKVQREWEKRRGEHAVMMDIYQKLNYYGRITGQNHLAKYKVVYPSGGAYLCGCVVENKPIEFEIAGQIIKAQGFIADRTTYLYETDNEEEAHYLAAIINSPIVDKLIKPMQPRGLGGPRNIHKKALDYPIPQYDPFDENHAALSQLGKLCSQKAKELIPQITKYKSSTYTRRAIKAALKEELQQIDKLARQILRHQMGEFLDSVS